MHIIKYENLGDWQELCEYLNQQPGKSAPKADIPGHLLYLLSHRKKRQRSNLDLVFYASGWGWRLRRDWTKRLKNIAM